MPIRLPSRDGLTLVEVLVAIVLFAAAVLAIAGTESAAARLIARAHQHRESSRHAADILDSLRSISCLSLSGGARSISGGAISWSAAPVTGAVRIALTTTRPPRPPWTAVTLIPCPS